MAVEKSELYSSLWKMCDELRGGMDASQYKDYVLVLLFVKYVSDRYAGNADSLIEVPDGGSFDDFVELDNEITALEQKRDKTNLIKQGMMQELLTGRTRLIQRTKAML